MNLPRADQWFAASVTVTPQYVEAAEFAFNGLDSLGTEVTLPARSNNELCTVTAYFSSLPDNQQLHNELRNAARIYSLPEDIDFVLRHAIVADRDWLAEWKKHWKPVEIGRFVIAAPWHHVDEPNRVVIRIEPNMAFGTGTHETTQLCLAAIDEHYRVGMSFLDVGTGTGILAIAAATMSGGDGRIVAVDVDDDAVAIARTNAEINRVSSRIEFSTGSLEATSGRFDLVCANLTANVIVPMLPDLLRRTGHKLILSGILGEQEEMVLKGLPAVHSCNVSRSGEWIAVVVEPGGQE